MTVTDRDRLNILLVEDNEDDYFIVRDLLRDIDAERFALEWAGSYADGLRAIRAQRHDVILLDFRLPGGTGLEMLRETQALSRRAPVIFMTGQGDHDIDVQVMEAGAADYLVKDRLDADLLERAIRYAVERQRSAEALRASEDRYRTFVENSTEGIWRFELEQPMPTDLAEEEQMAHLGRHAYVAECNEAMAHLYGYERASGIIGARFGQFLSASEAGDDNYLRRLIHNGYRLVSAEAFASNRTGQPKYVLHSLIGVVEDGLLYRIWGSQVDITEQKRAERAQAQLASIVESSDDAIYSKTLDGLIVTWNKGAEALYGYTAQEAMGQPVALLRPFRAPEEMHRILTRIRLGERVAQFETVHCHKDGRHIDVSLAVSPIVDAAGRATGASAIARDISEQKRAEERLRFNALLLSQVRNAVIATDLAGQVTYWNDFAETLYQWKAEEVVGRSVMDLMISPSQIQQEPEEIMGQIRETGSWEGEFMAQRKDGSTFPAYVVDTLFRDANGAVAGVVGVSIDITERRRAEDALRASQQKLRFTLESGRFGTFELDLATGRYLEISDIGRGQFGLPSDGDVFLSDFFQKVHPDDVPGMQSVVVASAAQEPNFSSDYRIVLQDGSLRWINVHAALAYDNSGAPLRMLGITQDITGIKEAEAALLAANEDLETRVQTRTQALQRAVEEAERANAAKSEFLSRMSHELRTPMNSILGFAQIMEMDAPEGKQAVRLGHILKAGQQLLRLINEVLDLAHVEATRLPASSEPAQQNKGLDGWDTQR